MSNPKCVAPHVPKKAESNREASYSPLDTTRQSSEYFISRRVVTLNVRILFNASLTHAFVDEKSESLELISTLMNEELAKIVKREKNSSFSLRFFSMLKSFALNKPLQEKLKKNQIIELRNESKKAHSLIRELVSFKDYYLIYYTYMYVNSTSVPEKKIYRSYLQSVFSRLAKLKKSIQSNSIAQNLLQMVELDYKSLKAYIVCPSISECLDVTLERYLSDINDWTVNQMNGPPRLELNAFLRKSFEISSKLDHVYFTQKLHGRLWDEFTDLPNTLEFGSASDFFMRYEILKDDGNDKTIRIVIQYRECAKAERIVENTLNDFFNSLSNSSTEKYFMTRFKHS